MTTFSDDDIFLVNTASMTSTTSTTVTPSLGFSFSLSATEYSTAIGLGLLFAVLAVFTCIVLATKSHLERLSLQRINVMNEQSESSATAPAVAEVAASPAEALANLTQATVSSGYQHSGASSPYPNEPPPAYEPHSSDETVTLQPPPEYSVVDSASTMNYPVVVTQSREFIARATPPPGVSQATNDLPATSDELVVQDVSRSAAVTDTLSSSRHALSRDASTERRRDIHNVAVSSERSAASPVDVVHDLEQQPVTSSSPREHASATAASSSQGVVPRVTAVPSSSAAASSSAAVGSRSRSATQTVSGDFQLPGCSDSNSTNAATTNGTRIDNPPPQYRKIERRHWLNS